MRPRPELHKTKIETVRSTTIRLRPRQKSGLDCCCFIISPQQVTAHAYQTRNQVGQLCRKILLPNNFACLTSSIIDQLLASRTTKLVDRNHLYFGNFLLCRWVVIVVRQTSSLFRLKVWVCIYGLMHYKWPERGLAFTAILFFPDVEDPCGRGGAYCMGESYPGGASQHCVPL